MSDHGDDIEEMLASLLYDSEMRQRLRAGVAPHVLFSLLDVDELEEAARGVRGMIRARAHRGIGGMEQWFPRTFRVWRNAHPNDPDLDDLLSRFCR